MQTFIIFRNIVVPRKPKYKDRFILIFNTNVIIFRDILVSRKPKYKDGVYTNIQYKRSLYLGTSWFHASLNVRTVCILIFNTNGHYI